MKDVKFNIIHALVFAFFVSLGAFTYQYVFAAAPNYAFATRQTFDTFWNMAGFYFVMRFFWSKV